MVQVEKTEGEKGYTLLRELLKNSPMCRKIPEYWRLFEEKGASCKVFFIASQEGGFLGAGGLMEAGEAGFFIPETKEACLSLQREMERFIKENQEADRLRLPVVSEWYLALERKGYHLKGTPGKETFLVMEKQFLIRNPKVRAAEKPMSGKTILLSAAAVVLLIFAALFLGRVFQQMIGRVSPRAEKIREVEEGWEIKEARELPEEYEFLDKVSLH